MLLARRASRIPILQPLHHRAFALLWCGQFLSRVGDTVLYVALPWLVYDITGSAVAMGSVVLLQNLPTLALLLVGGVAVDRFPRQRVMLASDALRGVAVIVIAALIARGEIQLWHLQAMAVVFGAASAFFRPAYSSIVPQLVPKEELVPANSLTSGSGSLAQVAGPMLGAMLVAAGGTSVAFAFDAATFGISALCLLAMRTHFAGTESDEKRALWQELSEGFRVVLGSAWLRTAIVVCAIGNAAVAGAYVVVLPLLVRTHLGGDVGGLGTLQSAVAAGTIIGIVVVAQHGMRQHRGIWFWGAILIQGLAMIGWGFGRDFSLALGFGVWFGVVGAVAQVSWAASLQEMVSPKLLGRVISIDMLGSMALMPFGFIGMGVLAERMGPASAFVLAGCMAILLAGTALLVPAARRFE